jgi:hypothetical protein
MTLWQKSRGGTCPRREELGIATLRLIPAARGRCLTHRRAADVNLAPQIVIGTGTQVTIAIRSDAPIVPNASIQTGPHWNQTKSDGQPAGLQPLRHWQLRFWMRDPNQARGAQLSRLIKVGRLASVPCHRLPLPAPLRLDAPLKARQPSQACTLGMQASAQPMVLLRCHLLCRARCLGLLLWTGPCQVQ